ncbi:capsule biosynthesis GfcC family protein [Idiomarina xiamenensis]|uniref:Uncharacterized protein n=1 Tax=Idiomarina xiamenensis 10-D-4 TaxID=740709 RepID=K2KHK5_9GAMM|nr:capsule biosynthesis GfcC family protein [Idiomarina xiamenensis]EKE82134.1 hypothetical protein A10D4_10164 [Idiomarina xiamenensis 10-D-4]
MTMVTKNSFAATVLTLTLLGSTLASARALPQQQDTHNETTQQVTVHVLGPDLNQQHSRHWTFSGPVRLSQVFDVAQPDASTYWLQTRLTDHALQQQVLRKQRQLQQRVKNLAAHYHTHYDDELAKAAQQLAQQIAEWPLVATYIWGTSRNDARTDIMQNPLLTVTETNSRGQYWLMLQSAPEHAAIVGLVSQPQFQLTLDTRKTLRDTVKDVELLAGAKEDTVQVITLDGQHRQYPVAYYNAKADSLAPGAVVFVGFDDSELPDEYQTINQELIELLRFWNPEMKSLWGQQS